MVLTAPCGEHEDRFSYPLIVLELYVLYLYFLTFKSSLHFRLFKIRSSGMWYINRILVNVSDEVNVGY